MTRLYAILGAIGAAIATVFAAFTLGSRSANNRRDAKAAKSKLDTFKKSTEAQDEVLGSSDDDITRRLRDRAGQ